MTTLSQLHGIAINYLAYESGNYKRKDRTCIDKFEITYLYGTDMTPPHVKIMRKDIGFAFKITKIDPEDVERMQYVYDVLVACDNNKVLSGLAKKQKPKFETIAKKFPGKINRAEWDGLDMHDKNAVISIIDKILNK
jgi:hypothetical protein